MKSTTAAPLPPPFHTKRKANDPTVSLTMMGSRDSQKEGDKGKIKYIIRAHLNWIPFEFEFFMGNYIIEQWEKKGGGVINYCRNIYHYLFIQVQFISGWTYAIF